MILSQQYSHVGLFKLTLGFSSLCCIFNITCCPLDALLNFSCFFGCFANFLLCRLLHIFCCIFDVFFGLLCFFSHLLGSLIYFFFCFRNIFLQIFFSLGSFFRNFLCGFGYRLFRLGGSFCSCFICFSCILSHCMGCIYNRFFCSLVPFSEFLRGYIVHICRFFNNYIFRLNS